MTLTKWTCPKCGLTVEALARSVSHRCPSNKSKPTEFVEEVK